MLAQDERSTGSLYAVSQAARTSPSDQFTRQKPVKAGLTSKRPRRQIENDEYSAFVWRVLHAYARRVGDGDVEALALMLGLAEEIDVAIAEAVKGRTVGRTSCAQKMDSVAWQLFPSRRDIRISGRPRRNSEATCERLKCNSRRLIGSSSSRIRSCAWLNGRNWRDRRPGAGSGPRCIRSVSLSSLDRWSIGEEHLP